MVKRDRQCIPVDRGKDVEAKPSRTCAPPAPARTPSGPLPRLACPLCPAGKTFCGIPSKLAQHQRGAHPGRGRDVLSATNEQLFHRYEVCSICGNLETNLSRHQSMCRRRTPLPKDPDKETERPSPDTRKQNSRRTSPSPGTIPDLSATKILPWCLEDVGKELDQVPVAELSVVSFATAKHVRPEHRQLFGKYLTHAIRLFVQAHGRIRARGTVASSQAQGLADSSPIAGVEGSSQAQGSCQADHTRLERAVKLLHVTPALLQSIDGRIPRQRRYELFAAGEIGRMLEWLISFAKQGPPRTGNADASSIRARVEHLAHQRGGITKAASLLLSPTAPPRNEATLEILRNKHPLESSASIEEARREATARIAKPPEGVSRIQAVEDPFSEDSVAATIQRGNPQSSGGPSGLRYSHLQQSISPDLIGAISTFARLVFEATGLPGCFWELHTASNLTAIGERSRPVASGDVLRRVVGGTFCRQYSSAISEHLEPKGQHGVSVQGGTELMVTKATVAYQQGYSLLTFDARNAFNSMKRRTILPALAELIPPVVPYAVNVYAREEPPKLLFKMDNGETAVIRSATGVQQGCTIGPLCYSAGLLQLLEDFNARPPVAGAQVLAFIDDLLVLLPPEHAKSAPAVEAVASWLQKRMEPLGVTLNPQKSSVLFPPDTDVGKWSEEDRAILARTQLTVAPAGVRVVGVPVGDPDYVWRTVCEIARGEPAALLRELTTLEDAQASFQILRLSAATRLHSLLRALPPTLTEAAALEFDSLLEWALRAIIAGQHRGEEDRTQARDDESHASHTPAQQALTPDAIRQARLPVREGGLGLPSAAEVSGPAFIGCQALVLARAMAANNRRGLDSALKDLASTPHATELCKELRKLTTFASGQEIAEMVGTSWAALALNKDPAKRGRGTLLVEAGASSSSTPPSAPHRPGTSQPSRASPPPSPPMEEDQVHGLGAKPHSRPMTARQVQSRITRALHAAQGRKLLSDLKAQADSPVQQRAYVRFAGARGKGAMAWVTCQGIELGERVAPALFREILARNLGSHDRDATLGSRCHEGCDMAPSQIHSLTCTRGGMQTHTHQALLHGFLTRTLRECRVPHEEETPSPFKEGTGNGQGSFRMDVVTDQGALFSENRKYNHFSLMLDVTVTNPLGPSALARAGTRAGYAIEEAVKAKNTKYGGTYRPTHKLVPLAFSTCGDY